MATGNGADAPKDPGPAAALRLHILNMQESGVTRWAPGAAAGLVALGFVLQYMEETDAELKRLREIVRGVDEVPDGLPGLTE